MSIDDTNVVDVIGVESSTGRVLLAISDHLDWSAEQEHLALLQTKINTYLKFIDSRQIETSFPAAKGRTVVIEIHSLWPPTEHAVAFLERASAKLKELGIDLRMRSPDQSDLE